MTTDNLERAILGCILLTGKGVEYLDAWWINETHFTFEFAKTIYKAIKWLSDNNHPIDPITVIHKLEQFFEEEKDCQFIPHELIYVLANEAPRGENLEVYVQFLYQANQPDEKDNV